MMLRNAPTLGDALEILRRAFEIGNPQLGVSITPKGKRIVFELVPKAPLGRLLDFFGLAAVALVYKAIEELAFDRIAELELTVTEPRAALHELLQDALGCKVKVSHTANSLVFPSEWADMPNTDHDPKLWSLARKRLQTLESVIRDSEIVRRVRSHVAETLADTSRIPKLAEIATEEHLSGRTLVRLLAKHNASFQAIVEQERRRLAIRLLNEPSLGLADVAHALGFSGLSSFSRAFRKWFGISPSQFRSRNQQGSRKP